MAKKRGRPTVYVTNDWGVTFSSGELKRLNRAVTDANRILALERSFRKASPLKRDNAFLDERNADTRRFRNKGAFNTYLRETERIARGTYFRNITSKYKANYIKSLERNFGDRADNLIKQVKKIKLHDFRVLVEQDVIEEIGYFYYDPANADSKVESTMQAIDKALGLTHKVGRPKKNAL